MISLLFPLSINVVNVLHVTLGETVHIKPGEMKWTKAVVDARGRELAGTWLISPNEEQLAKEQCDITKALLEDVTTMIRVPLNNWGSYPIVMKKGMNIGRMEEVVVVRRDDPVWADDQISETVRVCQTESTKEDREEKLCSKLQFGSICNSKGQDDLRKIVCKYNDVFALCDDELGETSIVMHSIDTGTTPPVKSTARRLPYALRKELEEEMNNLLQSGCIEPSISPYSSLWY